jgi:hypothetical protein
MKVIDFTKRSFIWIFSSAFVALLVTGGAVAVRSQTQQQMFASPEDAVAALKTAVASHDRNALASMFGPRIKEFLSGDPVTDKNDFDEFAANLAKSSKLESINEQKETLLIGDDDWPFSAPIVKTAGQWRFDTDAGIEELTNRRIGENEIVAIYLCQAYAIAQFEYFNGEDWDHDQVSEYAQKISSSPGQRDGLYWDSVEGDEDESPLGPLFAYAAAEGYKARKGTVQTAAPFHGYNFKVLYRQGTSAPGGSFSYMINGNMIAGFALVAYPAKWGRSGIMTFIVNQEGRVYQKNLGPQTGTLAAAMTAYDPDGSWELADPE